MPVSYQIMPEHKYPHQVLKINNNTVVEETVPSSSGNIWCLYVFTSPKGKDGIIQTIKTGLEGFKDEYGLGPFSLYGQPYLNAYAGFMSENIIGHCLRITAKNSAYACANLCAQYTVDPTSKAMKVRFVVKGSTLPLTDLDNLETSYEVNNESSINKRAKATNDIGEAEVEWPEEESIVKEVKLLSVAYVGRGEFGNNVRFRITSDTGSDKENKFKNYFLEEYLFENGANTKVDEFPVIFNENAKVNGVSSFVDTVVNHEKTGSTNITTITYQEGFDELWNAYYEANPNTELTIESFDPFMGVNKYTKKAITNYSIDPTGTDTVSVNALSGIALIGGDDGDLTPGRLTTEKRKELLDSLYEEAFLGSIDPNINSRNKYPTTFIFDANFNIATKLALVKCVAKRMDCVGILDVGLNIKVKSAAITMVKASLDQYVQDWHYTIEAFAGKATDPYSGKPVTVTSTYGLSGYYPIHCKNRGDGYKHIPLAGNTKGAIPGYIEGTMYPVYDEDLDLDKELMDEMQENRINYLSLNPEQLIVRDDQLTRDVDRSNLSDLSNVLVLLDVVRDCRKICARFEFDFADPEDIARFNAVAEDTLGHYKDQQVHSITAEFNQNKWEAKRNIIHLNVAMAHRNIIKNFIIEVDVNRPD